MEPSQGELPGSEPQSPVPPSHSQPFPSLASTSSVLCRRQTPAGALTPQRGVEGSLTHPQQENLRLAHVNKAGPGHVTDTGETGWSHSLGLVAFTQVLEARTRAGMGPAQEHHLAGEDVAGSLLSACSSSATPTPMAAFSSWF